jgi:non-ribosomal peptide synthase protein (TIGR01720 family)
LLAGLARILGHWMKSSPVLIHLEGHGRESVLEAADVSRTVGWFTSLFPVQLAAGEDRGWGEQLQQTKEGLRRIPHRGMGYGVLRYLSGEAPGPWPQPQISFNYLGKLNDEVSEGALFAVAAEEEGIWPVSGQAPRAHLMDVEAIVWNGSLRVSWWYGTQVHRPQTVSALADGYIESLREIIRHCQLRKVNSPSTTLELPLTQDTLSDLRLSAGLPALVAIAERRGQAPVFWADGAGDLDGDAASRDVAWHLGSIAKSMTATLVARLVEQGRVRWDDTVGEVLGDLAPGMQSTTLRHLLSHRSGLSSKIDSMSFPAFSHDPLQARDTRRRFLRMALEAVPCGAAKTTFEYSNAGYIAVAALLEQKTDQSWEQLMRTHLFEPLGLHGAGFGAPEEQLITERSADELISDNPILLGPAGGVHMSLSDLLIYLRAHRDRTSFLRARSWKTLHTPPFGGHYALGWHIRDDGTLWHGGSTALRHAEASFDAVRGIAIAAATSGGDLFKSAPIIRSAMLGAAAAIQ